MDFSSIINNPLPPMEMFYDFLEWFESLYEIRWVFFGAVFTFKDLLYFSAFSSIMLEIFTKVFGMTQDDYGNFWVGGEK